MCNLVIIREIVGNMITSEVSFTRFLQGLGRNHFFPLLMNASISWFGFPRPPSPEALDINQS